MTDEISQQAADDADLAAVLGSLDQLSVEETPELEFSEAQETLISPVLENLREGVVRPSPGSVCEGCPNAVWQDFEESREVKCYCRVLFTYVTSTKEPVSLRACDGLFLGGDEE
jgi:hypothetical protein